MYRQFWGSVFFKENLGNCSRQHMRRGNYKFKLKLPSGLAAVARLLRAACRRVNAPVVFLCFYFCGASVAPQSRCLSRPVKTQLYTVDMATWLLFTANKNAVFNNSGTRLAQRAETGLFDPVIFTVYLSSIQCNHVGCPFSTKLGNVALILYTLCLRHFLMNMSFCLIYARGWPRA